MTVMTTTDQDSMYVALTVILPYIPVRYRKTWRKTDQELVQDYLITTLN